MAGERILIVDDNEMSLKLAAYLFRANGYEVDVADDAESAHEAIRRNRPAAVLMDIQLPGASGLELVRRLRADPSTRDTLIIAVTAYAMKGDKERVLAAGCDDYITKPIDTRTLPIMLAHRLAVRVIARHSHSGEVSSSQAPWRASDRIARCPVVFRVIRVATPKLPARRRHPRTTGAIDHTANALPPVRPRPRVTLRACGS